MSTWSSASPLVLFYFCQQNEDNSAPVAVQEVAKPEEARKAERKFVYDGDNLSDFDDDEASLPSWSDPKSAGWTLLQMSALHLLADGLKTFLPLVGVELAGLYISLSKPLIEQQLYLIICFAVCHITVCDFLFQFNKSPLI